MSTYSEQTTWRLDHPAHSTRYLKVVRAGAYPTARGEAERTRWARPFLPVPQVIDAGTDGELDWLVTATLDGRPATDTGETDRRPVVVALAEGLRRFHDTAPVETCPFDFRVEIALAHVSHRAAARLIDTADAFNDDHRHLDLQAALDRLERLRPPTEDLVVSHGDYCPPNVLVDGGRAVGYVDFGELGSPTVGGTSPSAPGRSPGTSGPASKICSSPPMAPSPIPTTRPSTGCCTTWRPEPPASRAGLPLGRRCQNA